MDDASITFGAWLRGRRGALHLTRQELASRANCSASALRKIEEGERRPSGQLAELIAIGLDLAPESRPTFLRVARGELSVSRLPPAAPTSDTGHPPPSTLSNLPTPLTQLIGRESELAELDQLLREAQCRLLTLAGPGGVGKTRLAIDVAAAYGQALAQPAYFISLAPLSSAQFIPAAMADALGFTFSGLTDPTVQLLSYLRGKSLLLVLDNFEHLLDGADLLAAILHGTSGVKVLVTSRERLDLHGEWVFNLNGLPMPPAGPPAGQDVGAHSAVALFLQSARRIQAGFQVQPGDWPAVARICRLVDGVPLAIELAAAWVPVLSCAEIATEIERGLDFLAASRRDVPERHRSMRAVFDHSWQLLSPEEQRVLCQLAVFRGGFGREAAEAVAGASLPVLAALAAKSLVQRTAADRYDLHELLRQYAALHLKAEPDLSATTPARHYAYYLALAEAAESGFRGPHQSEWLKRLEQEHDNLRAALDWALICPTGEQAERALQLAGALSWFWYLHGYFVEGREWLEKALRQSSEPRTTNRARALDGLALLANVMGDHGAARDMAEASAALFRELGDQRGLAGPLTTMGCALNWMGEATLGEARLAEALALYREAGDRWDTARVLIDLGACLADQAGEAAGQSMLDESASILEELGDKHLLGRAHISLGILALVFGHYDASRSSLQKSVALGRATGDPLLISDALTNLGGLMRTQGDYAAAHAHLEEAYQIMQERGFTTWCADSLCALAENELDQGRLAGARGYLEQAVALTEPSDNRWLQALVRYFQGRLAFYLGDAERAVTLLDQATGMARQGRYKPDLARSLVALGCAMGAQGEAAEGAALLREGLALFQRLSHPLGIATALEGLAGLATAEQAARAVELFGAAEAIRERLGAPLPRVDCTSRERDLAGLRAQLGEPRFAAGWVVGRAMPLPDAVARALEPDRP